MAQKTWVGGSGAWDSASSWRPQGEPGAADDVLLGAGANVTIAPGSIQVRSLTLSDPSASLLGDPGVLSASNGITLSAGTLTYFGSIENTTLRLQGGTLGGDPGLDNVTIVGTYVPQMSLDFAGGLGIRNTITLAPAAGHAGLIIGGFGGFLSSDSAATLDGAIAIAGSLDPGFPTTFDARSGPLTLGSNLTLDVTAAARFRGAGTEPGIVGTLTAFAPINVAPGGSLSMVGGVNARDAVHIASGTLDLSGVTTSAGTPVGIPDTNTITFDDAAGKLILNDGQTAQIDGFRAGDTIDIKGLSVSGALTPNSGILAIGPSDLQLMGQSAPGATYAAAADGSGGTLVTTTAQPAATVAFSDQTTGASGSHALDAASGGPAYLHWQYIDVGGDTTAMAAGAPDVFLKGGSGTKALSVASGQNVLDGGTGSAFIGGGSGTDTFFVDVRGAAQVWDTLTNFHAGDAVTVWGWSVGSGTERWDALDGAAGYQGATLRLANGPGGPVSSVTFAGLSADQAAHLQMSTGSVGGLDYLYISNPGV